jgi:hypothetical protein
MQIYHLENYFYIPQLQNNMWLKYEPQNGVCFIAQCVPIVPES